MQIYEHLRKRTRRRIRTEKKMTDQNFLSESVIGELSSSKYTQVSLMLSP